MQRAPRTYTPADGAGIAKRITVQGALARRRPALPAVARARYRRRKPMPTLRTLSLSLLLSAPLLPACDGGDEQEGPDVDCSTATVPKFAEITAWGKCTSCHSSTLTGPARNAAPAAINYDDYASARTNADKAMHEVYEGEMPPAASPQLTDAEKTQIYNWASCDTPQ